MSQQGLPGPPQNAAIPLAAIPPAGNQAPAHNQAPAVNQAPAANQSPASSQNQHPGKLNGKWNPFGPSHADSWWRRWWMQLAAVFLSISCLLANVGILYSIDEKPLAVHQIFDISITPNTLISIFSTISSFMMIFAVGDCLGQLKWTYFMQRPHRLKDLQIFDDASRGPVGAVVFLFRMNIKAFIASIGALITVAALANDPFTQALLQYPSDLIPLRNGSAVIPRTMQYLGRTETSANQDPYLSNAFWGGLYNPNGQVNYTCNTGDCTWEAFQSLAFCSHCEDITHQLHTNCTPAIRNTSLECEWTTPMGSVLPSIAPNRYVLNYQAFTSEFSISGKGILPDSTGNDIGEQGQIAYGDFIQFQDHYNFTLNYANISDIPLPKGTSCSLSWCMKTYRPEFKEGKLRDVVVNETVLQFTKDAANTIQVDNKNGGGTTKLWPGVAATSFPNDFDAYTVYQHNQSGVFWVNGDDMSPFSAILVLSFGFDTLLTGQDASGGNNPTGSALNGINNGNITQNFDRIATAISDAVRQASGNARVVGEAFGQQTFVRVRWKWLAFAASIVFLTAVFVTFSIVFSLERGESIWKSSSIALLFHGLKGWTEQELDVQSMDEMEEKAKGMHTILERDDVGRMVFIKSQL